MKNFICLYSVDYWSYDEKEKTEYGLLHVDDFRDAMNQLEGHIHGNDLMKINFMELYETTAIFSKEVFDLVHKEIEQGL